MKNIYYLYRKHFREKEFLCSILTGVLFFIASLVINYIAGVYASNQASNAVTDIILSNIRAFKVDAIFVYGSIAFWIGASFFVLMDPRLTPFTLKSIAIFIIIRSFFIILTHIGPSPNRIPVEYNIILNKLTFGGDLFFSGHTGLPFLMSLLFWDNRKLRLIFIAASLIFGVSVIMGHYHYSIDVFGAYFITYTIYQIARRLFPIDEKIFKQSPLTT